MNKFPRWIATLFVLLGCCFDPSVSDAATFFQDDQPQRKLFVPFDDLDVLLLDASNKRVMLNQQEYEELLAKAKKRTIELAPVDSSLVSAKYSAKLDDGIAFIQGELKFSVLNEGLIAIPLSFEGVAIRNATLDNEPASLLRKGNGLQLIIDQTVENKKPSHRFTLKLEMMVPIATTAARQSMSLRLPASTATQFKVNVPGNVEVKQGASVVGRIYDDETDRTEFDLLLPRKTMNLVMSLNNKQLKDEQIVVTRSVSIHELTPEDQTLHSTCSVNVVNGAMEEIEFAIPDGFQVESVDTRLLSQWSIRQDDQGSSVLVVKLREATREDFVLNLKAIQRETPRGQWKVDSLKPLNVAGQASVIGVVADPRLVAKEIKSDAVIPIDHEFLFDALPATFGQGESNKTLDIIGAFYSPQEDFQIGMEVSTPAAELVIRSNSLVTIGNNSIQLECGLEAISRFDRRISLPITLPKGWRITDVQNQQAQRLPFVSKTDRPEQVTIQLPKRLTSTPTQLFLTAEATPDGWLDPWDQKQVKYVNLQINDATEHTGSLAIATREDITLTPTARKGLELLEETGKLQYRSSDLRALIGFRFEQADFELEFNATRISPVMLAQAFNFFNISPSVLRTRQEILFNVKNAGEDTFVFELPLETPSSISIKTADNRPIKDSSQREMDGKRRWTVQLASPAKGNVHFLVDYEIPRADESEIQLQPVVVPQVQLQNSFVVVEGNNELDTEIENPARVIDLGELSLAKYSTSRQVVGAFAWPDNTTPVSLKLVRRDFFPLPSAIVQQADLVSVISTDGKLQTAARFAIATKQLPFLEVELPENSTLWSVRLDNQPAKPQLQDKRLLISLLGNQNKTVRDLQIVYESPTATIGLTGKLQAVAPVLRVNRSASDVAEWEEVPQVDSKWRLVLPKGYSVTDTSGPDKRRRTVLESLGYWCEMIGGESWLPNVLPMETREAARRVNNQFNVAPGIEVPQDTDRFMDESVLRGSADFSEPQANTVSEAEKQQQAIQSQQKFHELQVPANRPRSSRSGPEIQSWAAKGLRSLNIQLNDNEVAAEVYQLDGSQLSAQLIYTSRVTWLACGLAVLLMGLSMLFTHQSATLKFAWVILLLLAAQGCSMLTQPLPILDPVIDLLVLVSLLSAIYFIVAGTGGRIIVRTLSWISRRWPQIRSASAALVFVCLIPCIGNAQQISPFNGSAPKEITSQEIRKFLADLKPTKLAKVPDDVLIIPFDVDDPEGRKNADRVLISYKEYQRLKQQSETTPPEKTGPAPYVISATNYSCQLSAGQDELIKGVITIDVLNNGPIAIPLNLSGGAFAQATVDGEPARLQFVQVAGKRRDQKKQRMPIPKSAAILHLEGRGKKEFRFLFRVQPRQQGGWRSVRCLLPVGATRGVTLNTSGEPTEIRLNSDADRRSIESSQAEQIETVLNRNGQLDLQWKPQSENQVVDQTLTVDSDAVFDVREDGIRLNWNLVFNFRGAERTIFRVRVPSDMLVEQVLGDNIRSWNVSQNDDQKFLDVTLLGAAKQRESFTVELTERSFSLEGKSTSISVPQLSVPSASLHRGKITVRKSPVIELKSGVAQSASRIDSSSLTRKVDLSRVDSNQSPLGIEEFQHYEFRATPFRINLEASPATGIVDADIKSLLRIGQSRFDVESLINLTNSNQPLYQVELELPKDFEITRLSAKLKESWNEKVDGDIKRVTVMFPNGVTGKIPLVLDGYLDSFTVVPENFSESLEWALPKIFVNGARQQSVEYAVQTDSAINVIAQKLVGLESTPIQSFSSWLVSSQRPLTKLAIRSLSNSNLKNCSGNLRFNRIRPSVEVESVTNVRTTLLAVEETVLLDFMIQKAGIREIQFELPKSFRKSRINALLVSEKIVTDVPGQDRILVTLKLQDDVIGNYRVVAELDSKLPKNNRSIGLPRVRTGNLKGRYVTIQNAGRDEIDVNKTEGIQLLNRQLKDYSRLRKKLQGAELTLAYVADKANENPEITFRLNAREIVDTVAASIGFSKTIMIVDHNGTYRAQQTFQINNRSEPYLDVVLPVDSTVLSAYVDGRAVKPVRWTQTKGTNRIRIPIVKTAIGDLDYPVVIKYGGVLPAISSFQETSFPVIETVNINVQLSQLHLRLPESFRWMRFGGTMTQVNEAGELEQDYLTYQSRQIEKLAEQLKSGMSDSNDFFYKQRAYQNLQTLNSELGKYKESNLKKRNGKLDDLIAGNSGQIEQYSKQLQAQLQQQGGLAVDNRYQFNALVNNQSAKVARNQINKADTYFVEAPQAGDGDKGRANTAQQGQNFTVQVPAQENFKGQNFDKAWLESGKALDSKGKDRGVLRKNFTEGRQVLRLQQAPIENRVSKQDKTRSLAFRNPNDPSKQAELASVRSGFGNADGGQGGGGFGGRDANADKEEISFGSRFSQQVAPARQPPATTAGAVDNSAFALDTQYGVPAGEFGAGASHPSFGGVTSLSSVALSSLDIQIPERGVDFFFRAPRGKISVTAVPVKENSVRSWMSIATIAIIAVLVWCVGFAILRARSFAARVSIGMLVGFVGLVSIVSGIMPFFGLIAAIAAVGIALGRQE